MALKSIFRATAWAFDAPALPTDPSIYRDTESGHLVSAPSEVITRLAQMETTALSPDRTLPPGALLPWLGHVRPTPTSSVPMLIGQIPLAILQNALRHTPNHKAAGTYGIPNLVLKLNPPALHEAIQLLFQDLAITVITPPSWLNYHIFLLYKKGDPTRLDKYRPITLASALYKLWITCIVTMSTDYIESRTILSPE